MDNLQAMRMDNLQAMLMDNATLVGVGNTLPSCLITWSYNNNGKNVALLATLSFVPHLSRCFGEPNLL